MLTNYTIKKGDTLWAIGRDIGLNWRFIHAMNCNTIADPNKIYVGQVITVPNKNLVYYLSLVADLAMLICPYKLSLLIGIFRFVIEAGSFKTNDVATFLLQNGISGIFAGKVEILYKQLGH